MAEVKSVSLDVEKDEKTNLCYIIVVANIKFTKRESRILADPELGPDYFTLKASVAGHDSYLEGDAVRENTKFISLADTPITESARDQTVKIEKTVDCRLLNEDPAEREYYSVIVEVNLFNNDICLSNKGESNPFDEQFGKR